MTTYRYRAFISYSHADAAHAQRLHRRLETYRPPHEVISRMPEARQRVAPVFLDRAELEASGSLSSTITAALEASEFLIVLCSPNAVRSRWVNEEVAAFKRMGRSDHVICVLVGGDPSEPEGTFPRACLFDVDSNGNLDQTALLEPLAADLRKSGDGQRRALLRIVANILGVRFDDLVRREAARRQQRLIAIAVASTVGMVLMAALAVFGFVQRNEAIRQRTIAQEETASLEQTVTFLIDIFQVSNPAKENPRDITALQILERGALRLRTERVGKPHVRGRLMSTIGDVYFNLGLYDEGKAEVTRALGLLAPSSLAAVQARVALANALFKQERYPEAERQYAAVDKDLGQRFPAEYAERGEVQRWWGHARLGRNDVRQAELHYRRSIELYRQGNVDRLGLSRTRAALAFCLMEHDLERLGEADALLQAALRDLLKSVGPSHIDTLLTRADLARLRQIQGRVPDAVTILRRVEVDLIRLLGREHPHVATVQQNLAQALLLLRDGSGAEAVIRRALATSRSSFGEFSLAYATSALNLSLALSMQRRNEREATAMLQAAKEACRHLGVEVEWRLNLLLGEAELATAFGHADARAAACAAAAASVPGDPAPREWWRREFRFSCPRF